MKVFLYFLVLIGFSQQLFLLNAATPQSISDKNFDQSLFLFGKLYAHLIPWGLDMREATEEQKAKTPQQIKEDGSGSSADSEELIKRLSNVSMEQKEKLAIMYYFAFPTDMKENMDYIWIFFGTLDWNSKKLDITLARKLDGISYEKYLSLCNYMGINTDKAKSFKDLLKSIINRGH